jgi:hypothetical protein
MRASDLPACVVAEINWNWKTGRENWGDKNGGSLRNPR